jgi:hypothetical protein
MVEKLTGVQQRKSPEGYASDPGFGVFDNAS